jgi:hypothetical protein
MFLCVFVFDSIRNLTSHDGHVASAAERRLKVESDVSNACDQDGKLRISSVSQTIFPFYSSSQVH